MPTPLQTQQIRSLSDPTANGLLEGVVAGSLLVLLVSSYSPAPGTFTVSDDNGNSWSVVTGTVGSDGGAAVCAIAYAENANAGDTLVTLSTDGAGNHWMTAIVAEFPAMRATGAFDVQVSDGAITDTANTGNTSMPAQARNLVVYVIGLSNDETLPATPAAGYTALDINTSSAVYQPISSGWKDIAAAAPQSAELALAVSDNWCAACAVFKMADVPPVMMGGREYVMP